MFASQSTSTKEMFWSVTRVLNAALVPEGFAHSTRISKRERRGRGCYPRETTQISVIMWSPASDDVPAKSVIAGGGLYADEPSPTGDSVTDSNRLYSSHFNGGGVFFCDHDHHHYDGGGGGIAPQPRTADELHALLTFSLREDVTSDVLSTYLPELDAGLEVVPPRGLRGRERGVGFGSGAVAVDSATAAGAAIEGVRKGVSAATRSSARGNAARALMRPRREIIEYLSFAWMRLRRNAPLGAGGRRWRGFRRKVTIPKLMWDGESAWTGVTLSCSDVLCARSAAGVFGLPVPARRRRLIRISCVLRRIQESCV